MVFDPGHQGRCWGVAETPAQLCTWIFKSGRQSAVAGGLSESFPVPPLHHRGLGAVPHDVPDVMALALTVAFPCSEFSTWR